MTSCAKALHSARHYCTPPSMKLADIGVSNHLQSSEGHASPKMAQTKVCIFMLSNTAESEQGVLLHGMPTWLHDGDAWSRA